MVKKPAKKIGKSRVKSGQSGLRGIKIGQNGLRDIGGRGN